MFALMLDPQRLRRTDSSHHKGQDVLEGLAMKNPRVNNHEWPAENVVMVFHTAATVSIVDG